jgi:hypothetical protein
MIKPFISRSNNSGQTDYAPEGQRILAGGETTGTSR